MIRLYNVFGNICRVHDPHNLSLELGYRSRKGSTSTTPISNEHGVGLILGGHDHLYFFSQAVDEWENYDRSDEVRDAEADKGEILVVKSGCDFRDLSEMTLELISTPGGSVRKSAKLQGKELKLYPA